MNFTREGPAFLKAFIRHKTERFSVDGADYMIRYLTYPSKKSCHLSFALRAASSTGRLRRKKDFYVNVGLGLAQMNKVMGKLGDFIEKLKDKYDLEKITFEPALNDPSYFISFLSNLENRKKLENQEYISEKHEVRIKINSIDEERPISIQRGLGESRGTRMIYAENLSFDEFVDSYVVPDIDAGEPSPVTETFIELIKQKFPNSETNKFFANTRLKIYGRFLKKRFPEGLLRKDYIRGGDKRAIYEFYFDKKDAEASP